MGEIPLAAPVMAKGGKIPLAAPMTGKGEELRVTVVELWRAGRVSLEGWKKVRDGFWDDGDGDRGGKLAGNASRVPGPKRERPRRGRCNIQLTSGQAGPGSMFVGIFVGNSVVRLEPWQNRFVQTKVCNKS